jgi:hypothetical protein
MEGTELRSTRNYSEHLQSFGFQSLTEVILDKIVRSIQDMIADGIDVDVLKEYLEKKIYLPLKDTYPFVTGKVEKFLVNLESKSRGENEQKKTSLRTLF